MILRSYAWVILTLLILMQIFDFFFKNAHWFYIIFSRPAGAANQFWGSFEASESRYCRRILIFKEMLNKISLNLSLKLGTFCKFLSGFIHVQE